VPRLLTASAEKTESYATLNVMGGEESTYCVCCAKKTNLECCAKMSNVRCIMQKKTCII